MQIQQRNLTYQNLKNLKEKDEWIMLNIIEINSFNYLRKFYDTHCKYKRVLSILHQ